MLFHREWSCETCKGDVANFAEWYTKMENYHSIVEEFLNELFCTDPKMNFDVNFVEYCQYVIGEFMPLAIPFLYEEIANSPEQTCRTVFDMC